MAVLNKEFLGMGAEVQKFEMDLSEFAEQEREKVAQLILNYAERFKDIVIVCLSDLEVSKSLCHQVYSLENNEEVFLRPKEKDEYEVDFNTLIGDGAFSKVYNAYSKNMDKIIATKIE